MPILSDAARALKKKLQHLGAANPTNLLILNTRVLINKWVLILRILCACADGLECRVPGVFCADNRYDSANVHDPHTGNLSERHCHLPLECAGA